MIDETFLGKSEWTKDILKSTIKYGNIPYVLRYFNLFNDLLKSPTDTKHLGFESRCAIRDQILAASLFSIELPNMDSDKIVESMSDTVPPITLNGIPFKSIFVARSDGLPLINSPLVYDTHHGKILSLFMGLLINEISPYNYQFTMLQVANINSENIFGIIPVLGSTSQSCSVLQKLNLALTKNFTDDIYNNKNIMVGSHTIREKIKMRDSDNNNVFRKISEIIVIRPKKTYDQNDIVGMVPSMIKWSHHFWVMGHWRRLQEAEKIGKDRDGNYCVKGMTWVSEHVRGDEALPLINKIRVIKKGDGNEVGID